MAKRLTEEMVIARTKISDLGKIKRLNCWGSELVDVSLLRKMPCVEVLSLSINKINSLADFQFCKRLEELYIRQNDIRDINEVVFLQNLPNLKNLWLGENPCANVEGYRLAVIKALPQLQKLDNVQVTQDELREAQRKGRTLQHPDDAQESEEEVYPPQQPQQYNRYQEYSESEYSPPVQRSPPRQEPDFEIEESEDFYPRDEVSEESKAYSPPIQQSPPRRTEAVRKSSYSPEPAYVERRRNSYERESPKQHAQYYDQRCPAADHVYEENTHHCDNNYREVKLVNSQSANCIKEYTNGDRYVQSQGQYRQNEEIPTGHTHERRERYTCPAAHSRPPFARRPVTRVRMVRFLTVLRTCFLKRKQFSMLEPISEIIDEKEDGVRPIILQFQNGEIQEGEELKLQTGVYRKPDNKIVVAAATDDLLYTGEIDHEKEDENPYNRFLLISNERTGKVRLVAVDTVVLAPQLKKKRDTLDSSLQNTSINNLNKKFGSKKIKRITEQKERLQMNIEDVREQLEKTVADIDVSEMGSFSMQPDENESLYRPPINREATTKEDVYILGEMVPENVLNSLEAEAKHVLKSDLDTLELTDFVKQHLIKLQNSKISSRLEKCKLLLYVNCLIAYIQKPAKNVTKNLVLCESPEVNSHILDNFSVSGARGRARPVSMRDKTICYILVLSMIALDYELDLEELAKSVKMGVKKLQEIARVLAFSSQGKNKNIMVLKIPLPPAVSASPRKRKR